MRAGGLKFEIPKRSRIVEPSSKGTIARCEGLDLEAGSSRLEDPFLRTSTRQFPELADTDPATALGGPPEGCAASGSRISVY